MGDIYGSAFPHEREPEDLSLRKIAWALCSDAQEKGYDHGSNPTMIGFDTPFPSCPRHLGIAQSVREALQRDYRERR
jgi:hypothetical protein